MIAAMLGSSFLLDISLISSVSNVEKEPRLAIIFSASLYALLNIAFVASSNIWWASELKLSNWEYTSSSIGSFMNTS